MLAIFHRRLGHRRQRVVGRRHHHRVDLRTPHNIHPFRTRPAPAHLRESTRHRPFPVHDHTHPRPNRPVLRAVHDRPRALPPDQPATHDRHSHYATAHHFIPRSSGTIRRSV